MNLPTTDTSGQSQRGGAAARAERDIINPATGQVIATVPEQFGDDVDIAVGKAQRAFDSGPWPQMPRTARARVLLRIADAIEAGSEQLYQLEARNNGRPITETRAQFHGYLSGFATTRACWRRNARPYCPAMARI